MKHFCITGLIILYCLSNTISQPLEKDYIAIQSSQANSSLEDLDFLGQYIDNVKLVGMGESTHGTSEFFTMRHKVFKYLVLNHNFNTFFLEADYASCLDIDIYIKSGIGDAKSAVSKINLWPWETYEMVELVEWMRSYNQNNPNRMLSFVGVDLQKFESTNTKLDSLIGKYGLAKIDDELCLALTDNDFNALPSTKDFSSFDELLKYRQDFKDTAVFNDQDKFVYKTLVRHLAQIIRLKKDEAFFSYRDIKMGENIIYHLANDSSMKGFFWAHNAHISDIYNAHRNTEKIHIRAGGILKKELGSAYFILGQEFDEGSFNAYEAKVVNGTIDDAKIYQLKSNTVEQSTKGTFGYFFKESADSILFIKPMALKEKPIRYLKMHDVGAVYTASSKNTNQVPRFYYCSNCYDAIILIKKSTATHLID